MTDFLIQRGPRAESIICPLEAFSQRVLKGHVPFLTAVLSVVRVYATCLLPNKRESHTGNTERTRNGFCQRKKQSTSSL